MTRKAITCSVRSVILWVGGRSESADADTLCPACLILIPPTTTRSVTVAGISSEIAKFFFCTYSVSLPWSSSAIEQPSKVSPLWTGLWCFTHTSDQNYMSFYLRLKFAMLAKHHIYFTPLLPAVSVTFCLNASRLIFTRNLTRSRSSKLKMARALARCDEGFGLSNLSKSFQDVSRVAAKSRRVDRRRQFSVAQLAPLMKTIVVQGALWVQTLWGSVEINWSEAEGQMFDKHSEVCLALKARHLSSRLRVQIHSPLLTGIEWHECVFTNALTKRAAVRIRRVLGLLRAQFCEG